MKTRTRNVIIICTCLILAVSESFAQSTGTFDTVIASNVFQQSSSSGTNYFMGKLGVGTATPTQRLTVNGSLAISYGNKVKITRQDGEETGQMYMSGSGTDLKLDAASGLGTIGLRIDGVDELFINSAGDVGIGTVTPSVPLHIKNSASDKLRLTSTVSGDWNYMSFYQNSDRQWYLGNMADSNSFVIGNDIAPYSHFTITQAGNVSIGTNYPSARLHVNGDGRFDQGVSYVKKLGDLSMGSFTNGL